MKANDMAGERGFSTPVPLIHTPELVSWSFYRAVVAEFLATFILMYVTTLTIVGDRSQPGPCSGVGLHGVSWAFGGMTFVLVYSIAGISGGHINPAITFGLFLARRVSLFRAGLYMVAQYTGAACGVAIVKALHPAFYDRYGGGVNQVAADLGVGVGLAAEIVGTFLVVYTFFSATGSKRSARDSHASVLAPLSIGVAVFVVHLATIPITGAGLNPARSWGAAYVYNKASTDQWVFWVGPFVGAAKAMLYHEYILGGGAGGVISSYFQRK